MQVTLLSNGDEISVELDNGSTVRQVLDLAKIHPSTVIVSYEDTVLPHSTILNGDIKLDITIVSSGG
ncbi:MAG: hypothetical protein CMA91_01280 [Euryarchaeota archaeon]|nr:hypothetical protein [Euryarchaeota archaeon]|tara:strand:+ start:8427 stop:8627 length:201 start_codon:yes stop_codon:yes gene_type:complete